MAGRVRGDVGDAHPVAGVLRQGSRRRSGRVCLARAPLRAMSDLPRRTVTALVYGAVVLIAVLAPPAAFYALLAAAAGVAALELVGLRRAGGPAVAELLVVVVGMGALVWLRI